MLNRPKEKNANAVKNTIVSPPNVGLNIIINENTTDNAPLIKSQPQPFEPYFFMSNAKPKVANPLNIK